MLQGIDPQLLLDTASVVMRWAVVLAPLLGGGA